MRFRATPTLAETMEVQGRQQIWLGRIIDRDKTFISHVLKGRKSISREHAEAIALALGCPFSVLFECADAHELRSEAALA